MHGLLMWKWLTNVLAAIALAFHPGHGHGQTIITGGGTASGGASCPKAVDVNSYCATSLGGNFQVTEASLRQSGQTWTVTANWNRCGIDYKCGFYTAVGSLTPVSSIASVDANCSFSATGGSSGGPLATCGGAAGLNIVGVDFTNSGGGTGTDCVPLHILSGHNSGTIVIKDSKFVATVSANNCTNNVFTGNGSLMIFAENGSSANFDFEYNNMDCGKNTSLASTELQIVGGSLTMAHNVALHCNTQMMIFPSATAPASITSYANFFEGMIYTCPGGSCSHGEWWAAFFQPNGQGGSGSGATGAWKSTVDTGVQDQDVANDGSGNATTTSFIYGEGNNTVCQPASTNACTWTSLTIDHGFFVANKQQGTGDPTVSAGIEFGSGNYGSVTITNSLFDTTGVTSNSYYSVGGNLVTTWNTHGTTTVDNVASNNLTSAFIGQYISDTAGDIPAGSFITAINSTSSFTMNQAASGTNTGTSGTLYNTHCNVASTLSGNQDMVSGAAINSLTSGGSINKSLGC